MKNPLILFTIILFLQGCTTQQKLAYLNNLSETGEPETFTMEVPDYRIQSRDVLYISIKAMTPDGSILDFLSPFARTGGAYAQTESGQYLMGYDVDMAGNVKLPVLGDLSLNGHTLSEAREIIQAASDEHFTNSTVECKLLSFKFTVIGEVRTPGTYVNYNNYLTVLEAIGRAGGINDYGRHDKIRVIRPVPGGTKTFTIDLQDKSVLSSEAYYLLPNDVIIIEPESKKIFNLNLPTISFVITTATSVLTSALLLINYLSK